MFYQKYRPQRVEDLDNENIRNSLGTSLLANKWSQAYLLTGPRGTGKTTTARLIAKIVNCPHRKMGEDVCGRCEVCLSIASGTALDIVEIDAASNRGIDEIRALREQVKLSPSSLKYKVYIIDEVHMLTTEAFNALLKTLEEPPAHVIFVLATTDLGKVPATIVSRCVHYKFNLSTPQETLRSLNRVVVGEKLDVEVVVLEKICDVANGSFRDASKILEQAANLSSKITLTELGKIISLVGVGQIVQFINFITQNEAKGALEWLNNYVSMGGSVRELDIELIKYLRNVLLYRHGISTGVEDIKSFSDSKLEGLIGDFVGASNLFSLSPVAQLPLEMIIAKWAGKSEVLEKAVVEEPKNLPEKKNEEFEESPTSKTDPTPAIKITGASAIEEKWEEILLATKPHNHSITAFLKAARPGEIVDQFLTIIVFYKFHKEKLEETKNRDIVEKVVSDIMGKDLKVKFILGEKVKS